MLMVGVAKCPLCEVIFCCTGSNGTEISWVSAVEGVWIYSEVYGNTVRTFRKFRYVASVCRWGVSIKWDSTVCTHLCLRIIHYIGKPHNSQIIINRNFQLSPSYGIMFYRWLVCVTSSPMIILRKLESWSGCLEDWLVQLGKTSVSIVLVNH